MRRKRIFGVLRKHLGEMFHELARHKDCKIVESHLMVDHVHICISIPPKYAVSNVVGYLKGKSAIQIARKFGGRQKNFTGENFWARGYFVSSVGLDEAMVRAYIRNQEGEDERYDQTETQRSPLSALTAVQKAQLLVDLADIGFTMPNLQSQATNDSGFDDAQY
jgi:putative transposase